MIKRALEIFLGIALSIIFIGVCLIIFFNILYNRGLEEQNFQNGSNYFKECHNLTKGELERAKALDNISVGSFNEVEPFNEVEYSNKKENYKFFSECATDYTKSSKKQLREQGKLALTKGEEYFKDKEVKYLPYIYGTNPVHSAILGKPQEYLFLLTDASESLVIGVVVTPSFTRGELTYKTKVITKGNLGSLDFKRSLNNILLKFSVIAEG